jgi:DMSO reductase anchor subunit
MKLFLATVTIAIIIISIVILGGELCLSDGCCYTTAEEIQRAQEFLAKLASLWCILLVSLLFSIFCYFCFKKNI